MDLPQWQRCCVKVSHVWREGRAGCHIMASAQKNAATSKVGWAPVAAWHHQCMSDSSLRLLLPVLLASYMAGGRMMNRSVLSPDDAGLYVDTRISTTAICRRGFNLMLSIQSKVQVIHFLRPPTPPHPLIFSSDYKKSSSQIPVKNIVE